MPKLSWILQVGLASAAVCLGTGCQSVSTVITRTEAEPTYPTSDAAGVEILRTIPADTAMRLGEVRAVPAHPSVPAATLERALRKSAASLGADAIVIVSDPTQLVGAYVTGPWFGRTVEHLNAPAVLGIAIKYP